MKALGVIFLGRETVGVSVAALGSYNRSSMLPVLQASYAKSNFGNAVLQESMMD